MGTHSVADKQCPFYKAFIDVERGYQLRVGRNRGGERRAQATQPASTSTQTADSLDVNVRQDAGNVNAAGLGKAERRLNGMLTPRTLEPITLDDDDVEIVGIVPRRSDGAGDMRAQGV